MTANALSLTGVIVFFYLADSFESMIGSKKRERLLSLVPHIEALTLPIEVERATPDTHVVCLDTHKTHTQGCDSMRMLSILDGRLRLLHT